MPLTLPTVGQVVLYKLHANDVTAVTSLRDAHSSAWQEVERLSARDTDTFPSRRSGYSAARSAYGSLPSTTFGNAPAAGDIVPLIVVTVSPDEFGEGIPGANGQALLDGMDSLWVISAREGVVNGTWAVI